MRSIFYFFLFFSGFFLPRYAQAQVQDLACSPADQADCEEKLARLATMSFTSADLGAQTLEIAKLFLGKPYQAATLDQTPDRERLTVNFQGFDCTTFLENVVAFSILKQMQRSDFQDFTNTLALLRYRNGKPEGYPSRLHYFSDWIAENQTKGILTDLTQKLGGEPYDKPLHFMSKHRKNYPALRNDVFYAQIKTQEKKLNQQKRYFIPKEKLGEVESKIRNGDLLAITTTIKGLDVLHVGFASREGGELHLLHASSQHKKIVVSKQTLSAYLLAQPKRSGIMVARLLKAE